MPPVSQQGSRAGLITALVFSIVAAIVFIITTFYYNSELLKAKTAAVDAKAKVNALASDDDLGNDGKFSAPGIDQMKKLLPDVPGTTVSSLLEAERDKVIKAALGSTSTETFDKAAERLQGAVQSASTVAVAGVKPTDPLPTAVDKLVAAVKTADTAAKTATGEATKAKALAASVEASKKEQIAEFEKKVAEAEAKVVVAEKAKTDAEEAYKAMSENATKDITSNKDESQKAVDEARTAKQNADAQVAALQKELSIVKNKLERYRLDTKAHMFAVAVDGEITRLGAGNIVYINLGSGDHLPPGLTFEVYNKGEGVPVTKTNALGDSGLPEGKASIEVLRIGQNSSECRVVHQAQNQTISQGDVIANLVYDRNTTYHFYVYGEFDVERSGTASAQQADIIKGLITRWGGKLDEKINIETDFVILGKEPKVPNFTQDELNDATNLDKKNKADAALKAYNDIITAAGDLHIPIMNQNRFLYYVGYYDQAKR